MAAQHEEGCYEEMSSHKVYACWSLQRTTERWRRGGQGHRISGDTAKSWFRNQRFRESIVGGATIEPLSATNISITAPDFLVSPEVSGWVLSKCRHYVGIAGILPE